MTKDERVVILLETYNEARAGDSTLIRTGEGGHRLLTNGELWHSLCRERGTDCLKPGRKCLSPYAELERVLGVMRAEMPVQRWHVMERYLRCFQAPRDVVTGWTIKDRSKVPVFTRKLITMWNHRVRPEDVRRGVEWIAESMSVVELPREYRDAMAKKVA